MKTTGKKVSEMAAVILAAINSNAAKWGEASQKRTQSAATLTRLQALAAFALEVPSLQAAIESGKALARNQVGKVLACAELLADPATAQEAICKASSATGRGATESRYIATLLREIAAEHVVQGSDKVRLDATRVRALLSKDSDKGGAHQTLTQFNEVSKTLQFFGLLSEREGLNAQRESARAIVADISGPAGQALAQAWNN